MAGVILFTFFLFSLVSSSFGAEKLKFGLAVRVPGYELTAAAADEQAIWKKNGLEVETFAFTGGGPFTRALAAKGITMGITGADNVAVGVSRGVPIIMVMEFFKSALGIWVDAKSAIKRPEELAGARLGLSSLGSLPHAYGQALAKALGLEGKIRFVAVGGIPTRLAALKTGAIDGHISPGEAMVRLQQAGEAREIVRFSQVIARDLVDVIIAAHKELVTREPTTVARGVKSLLEVARFLRENPGWATAKINQLYGHSPEVARIAYDDLMARFTRDGKTKPQALENLLEFLIKYDLLAREKAPRLEEFYTGRFLE